MVGDSVHGRSAFNRQVVRDHAAPPGRLMLHCLRLSLPTLPGPASEAWSAGEIEGTARERSRERETPCPDDVGLLAQSGGRGEKEERGGVKDADGIGRGFDHAEGVIFGVGGGVGHANGNVAGGDGRGDDDALRSRPGEMIRGWPRQEKSEVFMSEEDSLTPPSIVGSSATGSAGSDTRREMVEQAGIGEGLEVYCPPPDDMMSFLRGMSWWEEGLIQAASAG